jgi:diguanylate cyclase (GGDEF)-like protein
MIGRRRIEASPAAARVAAAARLAADVELGADPSDGPSRDRAGDRRDRAAARRTASGRRRDRAAELRDRAGDDRDVTANERDDASERRDLAADNRDRAAERMAAPGPSPRAEAGAEGHLSVARREAASDRAQAALDRLAAGHERSQAEHDRRHASDDRGAGAGERRDSGRDRRGASADREASARARDASAFDGLTGAYLRGAGMAELEREMARARRTGQSLVAAYVDVDHLKSVNDRRGHAAGDDLLCGVANALQSHLRPYDLVIRFGGDEFVCVMAGLALVEVATRIAGANESLVGHGSMTAGLAEMGVGDSTHTLLARADAALYRKRLERTT